VTVSIAYGALFYGFSVLLTRGAAGGAFSTTVLSTAYGGAVLTAARQRRRPTAWPDRHGVRGIIGLGSVLGGLGLGLFAAATRPWQVLAVWWLLLGPVMAMTFYEPAYVAVGRERVRAIATLTFLAGLSGPVFTPVTGLLVEAAGWRSATALLGLALAAVGGAVALLLLGRVPRLPFPAGDAMAGCRLARSATAASCCSPWPRSSAMARSRP
jgi:hypothetical protein